jgi:hypothetical protein
MSNKLQYDDSHYFGSLDEAGDFPNIWNLGVARIGLLTVDLFADGAALPAEGNNASITGGPLTVNVYGGDDAETQDALIGTNTFSADDLLAAAPCRTAVSQSPFRYIRVAVTGSFDGVIRAYANTQTGG